jgi:hypothetical protein
VPRTPFWQIRFYDFNVWTAKKRVEKLNYMHQNPVKRGMVAEPGDWRWSSCRFYSLGEGGRVAVNEDWEKISFREWVCLELVVSATSHPTLAKCARVGHPSVRNGMRNQNLILRLYGVQEKIRAGGMFSG